MINATYISSVSFSVEGDRTEEYTAGRKLLLLQGVGGTEKTAVVSSSYSAGTGLTTVVVTSGVLSTLVEVWLGPDDPPSIGVHDHTSEDQAGLIHASALTEAQVDSLQDICGITGLIEATAPGEFQAVPGTMTPGFVPTVNEAGDGFELIEGGSGSMPDPTEYGQTIRSRLEEIIPGFEYIFQGPWAISTEYTAGGAYDTDAVSSDLGLSHLSYYACILTHTSTADDQPGIGVNWKTCWVLVELEWEFVDPETEGQVWTSTGATGKPEWRPLEAENLEVASWSESGEGGEIPHGDAGDMLVRNADTTKDLAALPIRTARPEALYPPPGSVVTYLGSAEGRDTSKFPNAVAAIGWNWFWQIEEGEKYSSDDDLEVGQPVYLDPVTGKFRLAKNNGTEVEANCCGIIIKPSSTPDPPDPPDPTVEVLLFGRYKFESDPSFTPGARVWVGADGVLTDEQPVSGYTDICIGRVCYGTSDEIMVQRLPVTSPSL